MENKNTDFGHIFRNSVMQKTSDGFTSAILDTIRRNPAYTVEYATEISYNRWWHYVFSTLFSISLLFGLYLLFYSNIVSDLRTGDFFINDIIQQVSVFVASIFKSLHLSALSIVLLLCVPFFLIIEMAIGFFSVRKQV